MGCWKGGVQWAKVCHCVCHFAGASPADFPARSSAAGPHRPARHRCAPPGGPPRRRGTGQCALHPGLHLFTRPVQMRQLRLVAQPAAQGAGGRGHSHQRAGGRHPRTERASQGRSPDCGPVHAGGARSQGSAASELASGVASDQATTRAPASAKPGASARATPGSEGCCESSPRLQHEHAAHSRPGSTR